jgi:hypothetical protein
MHIPKLPLTARRTVLYALVLLTLAPAALAFQEKTTSYYGYIYGSNGVYCRCQIGPCGYDDLLGEKTLHCDGTTSSWGITEGCFTRTVVTWGDQCPAELAAATSDQPNEAEGAEDNNSASVTP